MGPKFAAKTWALTKGLVLVSLFSSHLIHLHSCRDKFTCIRQSHFTHRTTVVSRASWKICGSAWPVQQGATLCFCCAVPGSRMYTRNMTRRLKGQLAIQQGFGSLTDALRVVCSVWSFCEVGCLFGFFDSHQRWLGLMFHHCLVVQVMHVASRQNAWLWFQVQLDPPGVHRTLCQDLCWTQNTP